MRTFQILIALAAMSGLALGAGCGPSKSTKAVCGNGICEDGEDSTTCAVDCPAAAVCGNGVCEAGENNTNCPADCPAAAVCGNGVCEAGETHDNCPADCPAAAECGNGVCEAGETEANCPADCGSTWLSCIALNYCYNCCGEVEDCWTACDAAATAEAVTQMNAFIQCLQTSCANDCGTSGTDAACEACIDANCSTQADACDWGLGGSGGCLTLNSCLAPCTQNPLATGTAATCPSQTSNVGLACLQTCFDGADDQAFELLLDAFDCMDEFCEVECGTGGSQEACGTCQQANCSGPVGACQSDG